MTLIDTRAFSNLSMLNLLLSVLLMAVSHEGDDRRFSILFGITFFLGYLVEVLGVKTGFPFGEYEYGTALGPRVLEVPVIIGVNWFLMVMGSGFLVQKWLSNKWIKILAAALIMVAVDVAIEAVAPKLNYWHWQGAEAPFMNYLGWFAVAVIMQFFFQRTVASHTNKLAVPYIITVAVFFITLNLTL